MELLHEHGLAVIAAGNLKFIVCIPSRLRADRVLRHPLFAYANICVHESEISAYQAEFARRHVIPGALIPHQQIGLSQIYNWMLQDVFNPARHAFVQFSDDDFAGLKWLMTLHSRDTLVTDPQMLLARCASSYICARDLPTGCCGYAKTPIPWERRAWAPFSLRTWVKAAFWGILDQNLVFDPQATINLDMDMSLTVLAKYGVLWADLRFYALCDEAKGRSGADTGGMAGQRTTVAFEKGYAYMQAKWGTDIIQPGKARGSGISVSVNLPTRWKGPGKFATNRKP